jgi:hypothetical protein
MQVGPTDPVVTQDFPTGPIIEGGGQVVERQIVPDATYETSAGSLGTTVVPGPESAPLPSN